MDRKANALVSEGMISIPRIRLGDLEEAMRSKMSGSSYKDSAEMERMRVASANMKDFPERKPDFMARSLELRQAVDKFVERWG